HAVAAPPAGREGRRRVRHRRLPRRLCQRGDRRTVAVRHHQHRHAGHLRQGVGRSTIEGGHGIADDVLDLLREYAANGTPGALATTCPSGGSLDIFIEPRLPKPLLLVFGESPAARTLVQMGSLAGFRSRAVGAAEIATLEIPPRAAYAVVATMGHFVEDALEAA